MNDDLTAAIQKLFPKLEISGEQIEWKGKGLYVNGDRDSLVVDGEFSAEQLRALVDWMQKPG